MARAPAKLDNEPLPEADRFGDYPHPRHTHRLLGHAAAETALVDAFGSGHMHHAWLIRGPEGVGKATTTAVVATSVTILILDTLLAKLLLHP